MPNLLLDTPGLNGVLEEAELCAKVPDPLLILGERGTGKTALAQFIHATSGRPGAYMDCTSYEFPTDLIQGRLFGHSKGAFTGASDTRAGLVEAANNGTFFLDELGEAPKPLQVLLLRLLENPRVRRVGESRDVVLNVRYIMATNRDLEAQVACGEFYQELYDRFGYWIIRIPPLRERPGDIALLANFFFVNCLRGIEPPSGVEPSVYDLLSTLSWPGNARQLLGACRKAAAKAGGGLLRTRHLPEALPTPSLVRSRTHDRRSRGERRAEALRMVAIVGTKSEAAQRLGISRQALHGRLREKPRKPGNRGKEASSG